VLAYATLAKHHHRSHNCGGSIKRMETFRKGLWDSKSGNRQRPDSLPLAAEDESFPDLVGIGFYIYDCISHPPFGASRLSILASSLVIGAGTFFRKWEE
jgi:hypothetical protein